VAPEVAAALEKGRPVVALETAILSTGLPLPHNLEAAHGCEEAIRRVGGVPATVAVLDGQVCIGLTLEEIDRMGKTRASKVSARDLGWAVGKGAIGATTVAGTIRAATTAGIRFMATGGIGGVHRGHPEDVSADLEELARTPVAVFCAGPKMLLDIRLTLERLESLSVPVLGYGCDEVPAFYMRHSGCRVDARVDGPSDAARVLEASWATGSRGIVVAIPPPRELEGAASLIEQAMKLLGDRHGPEVTPYLLGRIAELSGGRSLDINVDLVVNNARVAAECAVAWYDSGG
jgi:pseudouridine-5'-phosphate glycosidase